MVPALYSLVKRVINVRAGFIAALLLATHSYSVQLVSGFRNTDHNDVIFSAFVLFSFWAWVRYTDSERMRDAVLTGAFVACAVLVKWLPGILVFGPWGLWMLQKLHRNDKLKWLHLAIGMVTAIALVLPWYIHIYRNFPAEAAFESQYNFLHMTIAMEGHDGPWYYHFDQFRVLLGWTLAVLSVPALFLFVVQDTKQRRALYITCAVLFFVVFYSIAKTKMPLFMLPAIPFLLAAVAVLLDKAGAALFRKKAVAVIVLGGAALFVLNVPQLVINHSSLSELAWYRDEMWGVRNKAGFYLQEKAASADAGKRVVMFNFPENERAAFMFYTGDIVYTQTPVIDSVRAIQQKGFVVGVYDNGNFPESYRQDATIRRYFSHLTP
jgi:4-amino-4-deoxy-L-arabinose transferase